MADSEKLNVHQLRQALAKISSELTIPFLQRRATSQSHKEDPLQELRDVIKQVTRKERDLQAAVGIASMLLDNNQTLQQKLESTRQNKLFKKQQISLLKIQIEHLREDIKNREKKNENISQVLEQTQRQLQSIQSENKILQLDLHKFRDQPETEKYNKILFETELQGIKRSFTKDIQRLEQTNETLQKKCRKFKQRYATVNSQKVEIQHGSFKLEREMHKFQLKCKQLEAEKSHVQLQKKEAENNLYRLQVEHKKLLSKVEKLEEELSILENQSTIVHTRDNESKSLMQELQGLDLDTEDIVENMFFQQKLHKSVFNLIEKHAGSVSVSSRMETNRKDPCEEYFTLATQSIKVNSPFMDSICTIPTNILYKKALNQEIPFHRWYVWIEEELHSAYIQMLYREEIMEKKQASSSRKKN